MRAVCWVDGRLVPLGEPVLRADDSAFAEGRGAYTTALVRDGRPRWLERHVARLLHAAPALGLGELEAGRVRKALEELSEAAFPGGEGIVRLQVSRDSRGVHLVGVPREIGPEPAEWSAIVARLPHPGAGFAAGAKVSSRLTMALARDAALAAGADEALLVDGAGQLVEAAGCNVVVVSEGRAPATPPLALGAVEGLCRTVALERVPELEQRPIHLEELRAAREILALNAVRGARPVVRLDGAPVGSGSPGPWAERFARAVERE